MPNPSHLCLYDNHSYMVGSCDHLAPESGCPACPTCGYRVDPNFTADNFSLKRKNYDISRCYDGAVIVSRKFKELCGSVGAKHLVFTPVTADETFFHLKCSAPVALNYEAMGTERSRYCSTCGLHRDFVGYSSIVLREPDAMPENALAFSDRTFGSNNEANPLVIAGKEFVAAIRANKLTGVASYEAINA